MELLVDLDLGDDWAEPLYEYQLPGNAVVVSNIWSYAGDNLDVEIHDSGYAFGGAVSMFRVPVTTNHAGLLIRRRMDAGMGGQRAQVFVDDQYAGTWYDADQTFGVVENRWVDSDFMVASNWIAGKSAVYISIVPLSASEPWNEFRYQVYGIKSSGSDADTDKDGLPDIWELQHVALLETLRVGRDFDEDGFSDLSEYEAGTVPSDAESYPRITSSCADEVSMDTMIGCLYTVERSSNLMSNAWTVVRSEILGMGSTIDLPVDLNSSNSFFRLRIKR